MKRQHSPKVIIEAGTDEAGRGCLAGPVTAAAVILPPHFKNDLLNDSKQLTEKQRNLLRPIIEKEAIAWAVAHVSPEEIDSMNILNASIEAMHRSIAQLDPNPTLSPSMGTDFILIKTSLTTAKSKETLPTRILQPLRSLQKLTGTMLCANWHWPIRTTAGSATPATQRKHIEKVLRATEPRNTTAKASNFYRAN